MNEEEVKGHLDSEAPISSYEEIAIDTPEPEVFDTSEYESEMGYTSLSNEEFNKMIRLENKCNTVALIPGGYVPEPAKLNDIKPKITQKPRTAEAFGIKVEARKGNQDAMNRLSAGREQELFDESLWSNPDCIGRESAEQSRVLDLVTGYSDLLSDYARDISQAVQYPVSSAYLALLGGVSLAMQRNHYYESRGNRKTPNLFIVTGQPPGAGKSGVLNFAVEAAQEAYKDLNKGYNIERRKVEAKVKYWEKEVKEIEKEIESSGVVPNEAQYDNALEELGKISNKLASIPNFKRPVTDDVTGEGAEKIVDRQCGIVNIVSSEAQAINTLFGNSYNSGKGSGNKTNVSGILKGWENEYMAVERSGREGYEGKIRTVMLVAAQEEAIRAIIEETKRGVGLDSRFLISNEPDLRGYRNTRARRAVNKELKEAFDRMVTDMVKNDNEVIYKFSAESEAYLADITEEIEFSMRDNERYSGKEAKDMASKVEVHVSKLATTMHCINNYSRGENSQYITVDELKRSYSIFTSLVDQFLSSADEQGTFGDKTDLEVLYKYLVGQVAKAKRGKPIEVSIEKIRGALNRKFQGRKLKELLMNTMLPEAEKLNWIITPDNYGKIYINPKLD